MKSSEYEDQWDEEDAGEVEEFEVSMTDGLERKNLEDGEEYEGLCEMQV